MSLLIESPCDILKDSNDEETEDEESIIGMYLWIYVIVSYDKCKQGHNYYKNDIL